MSSAGGSTATVGVRILLQDGATAGLDALGLSAQRLGYQFGLLGQTWKTLDPVQKTMVATTAVSGAAFGLFAGALVEAIKQGETIQDTLTNVSIAVKGADQNVQAMQDDIIGLADNSIFSVSQIGDGFVALGEHSLDAATILKYNVGTAMVDLAEAIHTQTTPAADLLAVSLQQMGASASQAANYANLLTGAFYNGMPSVTGMQSAITATAPSAVELGVSFEDLLTTLDILSQKLGDASQAGTALRNMLKDLTDPTAKAQKDLADLGIIALNDVPALQSFIDKVAASGTAGKKAADLWDGSVGSLSAIYTAAQKVGLAPLDKTFFVWAVQSGYLNDKLFDAQGKFLGVQNAVDLLGTALQNLPPEQKAAILTDIFNIKGSKGIESLTNDIGSFNTSWSQIQQALQNTSATQDAKKQTDTLSGAIKEFGTTLKDAFGLTGLQIIPSITAFIHHLNSLVDGFNHLNPHIKAMVGQFLMVGTAISGGIFGFTGLTTVLMPLLKHVPFLSTIFGHLGGSASKMFHLFKAGGGDAFEGTVQALDGLARALGAELFGMLSGGNAILANFFSLFTGKGLAGLSGIQFPLKMFTGGIGDLLGGVKMLIPGLAAFGTSIIAIAGPILLIIGVIALVVLMFTAFKKQGQEIVNTLRAYFLPVWHDIEQTIKQVVGQIMAKWKEMHPQLEQAMKGIVAAIKGAQPFFTFIGGVISNLVSLVAHVIGGLITGFLQALPFLIGFVSAVITLLGDLFGFIGNLIHGNWGAAWSYFTKIPLDAWNVIAGIFKTIGAFIWGFIQGIVGFFQHLWKTLVGGSIWTDTWKTAEVIIKVFVAVVQAVIKVFVDIVVAIFNILKAGIQVIITVIVDIFKIWWAYLMFLVAIIRAVFVMPLIYIFGLIWLGIQAGIALVTGRWQGFHDALVGFWNAINSNVIQPIVSAFQGIWDNIKNGISTAQGFWTQLQNAIMGFYNAVIGPLKDVLDTIGKIFSAGNNKAAQNATKGIGQHGAATHATGYITNGPEFALIGEGGEREIVAPVSKLIQAAQMAVAGNTGSGTIVVPIYIDGKQVAKAQFDMTGKMLRSSGFGRRFR